MNKLWIIIPVIAVLAAALLFGCKAKKSADWDNVKITSFSYSQSGMSTDSIYTYTLTRENGKAVLHADLNAGYYEADAELDESAFDTLSEIARQYKLEEWDGFDKVNKMALDGSSFRLHINLEDGSSIDAYGSNSFPTGYGEASRKIVECFASLVEENAEIKEKPQEY